LIDQVLLNLAVNARGAMPAGGQLTIGVTVTNGDARRFGCISVTDTGSGIAAEHLPHIFEPFFTTKDKGEGTGLGLATSYAVVQQHGGRIDVETEVGRGSTFRVYLPIDRSAE
jgi:signal transduction histidine kinase